jgi:diguanylate cyclase (GGDEF)-like protein/PAS domain S-box-containing protein
MHDDTRRRTRPKPDELQVEERLRMVTRARKVTAECSRVQARASDEDRLLRDMCRIVVESGGYRLTWIGMVEDDADKTIRPVASAGDDGTFLKATKFSWAPNASGAGPAGAAVRGRKPQATRNLETDPYFSTRFKNLIARGYRAAAAFPLMTEGRVLGVIGILAGEPDAFDDDELALLEELAGDIAYSLSNLRLRATQRRAEELLRESEARFRILTQISSDTYWEMDTDLRFTALKGEGLLEPEEQVLGKKREEMPGMEVGPDWELYWRKTAAREPFRDFVYSRIDRAGVRRFISISGEPMFDAGGRFEGYRGVGKEVTASKREERLSALEHAVTRCLAESGSAAEALQTAIRAVCETEGWDCGRYFRLDEAAGVLRFDAAWGVQDAGVQEFIERSRSVAVGRGVGLAGCVWESGEPLWIADITKDTRTLGTVYTPESGIRAAFLFPVTAEGRTIGVLAFSSHEMREPDQRLLEAVRAIGSQIGQFLRRRQGDEELQRFRAAMDTSSEMIMLVDRATMRFIDANTTACELQGRPREAMLQIGPQDVSGLSREVLERDYDAMIASGRSTWRKGIHRRGDGTNFPVEVFRRAVQSDGRWIIVAIVRDVSERMRAEALQNLEHGVTRSLSGAESASVAMQAVIRAICESEDWECGRYFRADEVAGALRFADAWHVPDSAFAQFVERSRDALYQPGVGLVGKVWQSGEPLWSDDLVKDPRAVTRKYSLDMGIRSALIFPVTAAGRTLGVLSFSSCKARRADEGLLRTLRAIGSQIGQFVQRKQAEAVLRESEARFRSLTTLSSDWYWEQDQEYRFVDMTSEIDRMTGVSALAHIGKRRWEIAAPNMTEAAWAAHRAVVEAHQPFQDLELCRLAEDGTERWVSISGEPIFDAEGGFRGYRGIGKDITARRREQALLALEHAVTRSLAEADSAPAGLKAAIRAMCETENWECGRYFHADDAAGVLRFFDSWHVPGPELDEFVEGSRNVVFHPGSGLVGRVWETGEPLWSADIGADPRTLRRTAARDAGVRAAFDIPITSEGRTIGVLIFSSRVVREPDDRLLRSVRAIGSQIGQFLQRKQAEEELRRFRVAMDTSGELILLIDPVAMRYIDVNDAACRALGYSRAELLAMGPHDVFSKTRGELSRLYDRMIGGELRAPVVTGVYRRKDGSELPIEAHPRAVPSSSGHIIVSIARDISERLAAEDRMREQALQQRLIGEFGQRALASNDLAEVLDRAAELVAGTLKVEYSNVLQLQPDAQTLLYKSAIGWPREWIGRRLVSIGRGTRLGHILSQGEALIIEDYTAESEFEQTPLLAFGVRSGVQVPIFGTKGAFGVICAHTREMRRFTAEDVSFLRNVANILAIAIERKNAEDKLAHLAQFDPVTGLPNRYLLRDRLGQALTQAQRNHWLGGVLFVDLDRFKAVNDTYGHGVGDKLLTQVAARLKDCVRGGDTVARLSGDEFAVVLSNLAKADDAGLVAQKIVEALAAPFNLDGHQTYISASVGIALHPADGAEPDTLLKNADTAMYRAKEQGRNCYQFYLPQMNERLMERLKLEARLRGALDRGEFRLHYQPKVQLDTGAISGFEALLRWQQDGKLVAPAEFIPILEDTGLIVPVGEWVLRTVCEQLKRWKDEGIAPRPVAVNLSARQFQHQYLMLMIEQILRETGVAPELLEFELTESLLMSDAEEAVQMLHELKNLGVRLSVDDFGTGYSSLSYLKRFPLDTLKIDRAFVSDAVSNPDDATLALTIINLAHSMQLKVVAEGVETQGQLNFLHVNGCDEMQGYFFARPAEVEECTRMLVEDRRMLRVETRGRIGQLSVLLVDDSEADLTLLKRALDSDDFRILTAIGPRAGFELLARHGADIVISDYQMPEMTGIEFLTNVRKMYPGTVRVVATGGDDVPTLTRAINRAGIHRFLSKNWDAERLRAEVREAYEQQQRRPRKEATT